jgi:hypothetical protein
MSTRSVLSAGMGSTGVTMRTGTPATVDDSIFTGYIEQF